MAITIQSYLKNFETKGTALSQASRRSVTPVQLVAWMVYKTNSELLSPVRVKSVDGIDFSFPSLGTKKTYFWRNSATSKLHLASADFLGETRAVDTLLIFHLQFDSLPLNNNELCRKLEPSHDDAKTN